MNSVHYSSKEQTWETPQDFFALLDEEFHFEIDVCALAENTKCSQFYTPEQDGLAQEWRGICWMNPPYGRGIGKWVEKAATSIATVVCLLPARTDTAWWHDYVMPCGEFYFVRGRLKFGGHKNNAPFPCAVVVFRNERN